MNNASQLHNEAMDLAERAQFAQRGKDHDLAIQLFHQAFERERDAAMSFFGKLDEEPTRSVLFRSAASLAISCQEFREAERLISAALYGSPPEEISEELRDLLENVNFARHFKARGVRLGTGEFQMSLVGGAIGLGIAPFAESHRRAQQVETLVVRTIERRLGLEFRERGRPSKEVADDYVVFTSVPMEASYAIKIRVGRPQRQKSLFSDLSDQDVVSEFLDCMQLFVAGNRDVLESRIKDLAYFRNFVQLAKQIAPDGKKVTAVGFTGATLSADRVITYTHIEPEQWEFKTKSRKRQIRLTGILTQAVKTKAKNSIGIVQDDGKILIVHVPAGLMNDIVRPLWDREVRVVADKVGDRIELRDIEATEEDNKTTATDE